MGNRKNRLIVKLGHQHQILKKRQKVHKRPGNVQRNSLPWFDRSSRQWRSFARQPWYQSLQGYLLSERVLRILMLVSLYG